MSPRLGSLFAGIGGFELAAKEAGLDVAFTSEIDKHCNRVLDAHFAAVPRFGDVTTLGREEYGGAVDVLTAGSPCQDFSIAGLRAGLAGSRSGLFEEFIRLIDDLGPRFAVWENVPGALTSNNGEDFANVIAAMTGAPGPLRLPKHPNGRRSRYAGVASGPYGVLAWRVLDAQHFGVPQRRQRIIAVLDREGWDSVEVLFPGYVWDKSWERRQVVWSGGSFAIPLDFDDLPFNTGMDPDEHPTVRLSEILEDEVDDRYYLTEKACKGILKRANRRGRSLPEVLDYALRCQAGEDVGLAPPHETVCVTGDVTHALKAEGFDGSEDGTGRGQPIVPETAHAVTTHGTRFDPNGQTFIPVPYRKKHRAASNQDAETWEEAPASNTLNTHDVGDVRATDVVVEPAYSVHGTQDPIHQTDTALPLESRNAPHSGVVCAPPLYRVRRLSPVECERLQGFPDQWTEVDGAKDSQRYHQIGNAIAVPVATWVLSNISRAMA